MKHRSTLSINSSLGLLLLLAFVLTFSLGISLLSSDIVNICYVGGLFYSVSAFLPMVFGLFVSLACILLISLIDRRASGRIGQDP